MPKISIPKVRFTPDEPGQRGRINVGLEKVLLDQAEFQQWNNEVGGTFPEFLVYRELRRNRLEPYIDFEFQSSIFGGRNRLGGAVVDFVLFGRIAGRVQGEYWHLQRPEQRVHDIIQRGKLQSLGLTVIDMLEPELVENARLVVKKFIQGEETLEAVGVRV